MDDWLYVARHGLSQAFTGCGKLLSFPILLLWCGVAGFL
jgi:hypothetical protein